DADPADSTIEGTDLSRTVRDFACLADLDRAANGLKNKRERDIFRARYIHGKTLKTIASKYGIGFQQVSKIARAARDKILAMDFATEHVNLRATLFQWRWAWEWFVALKRNNELIRTRGRRARLWTPGDERFGPLLPLSTANRLALWRLAEFERED